MGEESSSLPSPGPLASWAVSLLPRGSNNKLQLQIDKGKEEATYASANFGLALTSSLAISLTVGTGGSMVKNPSANAGDASLIPGSGKTLEEKMATHSSILVWEIPWTEEPGGL